MLHLNFALNLEKLADKMIDTVSQMWSDPFNAPVVIFPDFKLEQWFRLRWMKRKGCLLNLNKCSVDKFLFNILAGNDASCQKLSADMLCNVILAYLMQKDETSQKPHWQTLDEDGSDEVRRYLFGDGNPQPDDVPDGNRLFDFANKMASLFLEYETSRPKGFLNKTSNGSEEGLLEYWNENKASDDDLFFKKANDDKSVENREKWQRKLYSAIFHKKDEKPSLLTQVFEKVKKRNGIDKKFQTIPFLYNESGGNFVLDHVGKGKDGKPLPVFIFGLSGLGQFYRVILQKYAEKYDVYAYIQNPCMEFWEDVNPKESYSRKWNKSDIPSGIQARMSVQEYSGKTYDVDDIDEENVSNENALLANWGRSGRDSIKLWCQATNYDFDFDEGTSPKKGDALKQDSLLHCVQYAIAHRQGDFSGADLQQVFKREDTESRENSEGKSENKSEGEKTDAKAPRFKSLEVKSAPTKIREIEYLHSDICKLLQDGARIEDILVVSPCLDEYRTAIKMVFDQTPVKLSKDEKKENEGFLHVRFAIVDSPAKASLTENALRSLFDVVDKGSISRPEFFSLVRNPVVQQVRGISDDDVADWENWIVETNTYRDRKSAKKNDWLHSVNRLLLSHMTKKNVKWNDCIDGLEETKPFYDIASGNNASLCRFVKCVADLEELIAAYSKSEGEKQTLVSDLDAFAGALSKWIMMQNVPDSMKSESFVYQRIVATVEQLRYQQDAGLDKIPLKIVEQGLLAGAEGTEYSCGNLFVNGITFMKFAPNRTVPVKHLFFIGADSTSFPGAKRHNTLDLRKSCPPWPGDDSPIAKNRYAFLCQLMSSSESFHLSYVGKDIRKDAELYPSSVVNDLQKFVSEALKGTGFSWKTKELPLDETRAFKDLFTMKSIRNKIAYENMSASNPPATKPEPKTPGNENRTDIKKGFTVKPPDRVSFYQLRKFLEDPFQFHVGRTLSNEDEDNVEQEVFEPVVLSRLDESSILKKAVTAKLSDDAGEYEKYKNELKLSGTLPDGFFGDEFWNKMDVSKNLILEQMELAGILKKDPSAEGAEDGSAENYAFVDEWTNGEKIKELQLDRDPSDISHWLLSGTLDWINVKKEAGKELDWNKVTKLMSVSSSTSAASGFKLDKYLSSYIQALVILAKQSGEEARKIEISIFSCDNGMGGPATAYVNQSPSSAKSLLEKIYRLAFGWKTEGGYERPYSKAVPAKLLDWPESPDDVSIFEFKEKLNEKFGGAWNYFDKKALFDVSKDVGFTEEFFGTEWSSAVEKMRSLIQLEFPKEELTDEEPADQEDVK